MSPQLPGSVEEELYDDVLPVGNLLFTMRAFYICVTCLRFSGGELRQKYGIFFSEVKWINSDNNSKLRANSPFYHCIYLTAFQNTHSPNFGSLERLGSILFLWDCESSLLKIEISLGTCNNHSPNLRWLVMDVNRAARCPGKYPSLATDTEVNSWFSKNLNSELILHKKMKLINSFSLSSQSERPFNAIRWFSIY